MTIALLHEDVYPGSKLAIGALILWLIPRIYMDCWNSIVYQWKMTIWKRSQQQQQQQGSKQGEQQQQQQKDKDDEKDQDGFLQLQTTYQNGLSSLRRSALWTIAFGIVIVVTSSALVSLYTTNTTTGSISTTSGGTNDNTSVNVITMNPNMMYFLGGMARILCSLILFGISLEVPQWMGLYKGYNQMSCLSVKGQQEEQEEFKKEENKHCENIYDNMNEKPNVPYNPNAQSTDMDKTKEVSKEKQAPATPATPSTKSSSSSCLNENEVENEGIDNNDDDVENVKNSVQKHVHDDNSDDDDDDEEDEENGQNHNNKNSVKSIFRTKHDNGNDNDKNNDEIALGVETNATSSKATPSLLSSFFPKVLRILSFDLQWKIIGQFARIYCWILLFSCGTSTPEGMDDNNNDEGGEYSNPTAWGLPINYLVGIIFGTILTWTMMTIKKTTMKTAISSSSRSSASIFKEEEYFTYGIMLGLILISCISFGMSMLYLQRVMTKTTVTTATTITHHQFDSTNLFLMAFCICLYVEMTIHILAWKKCKLSLQELQQQYSFQIQMEQYFCGMATTTTTMATITTTTLMANVGQDDDEDDEEEEKKEEDTNEKIATGVFEAIVVADTENNHDMVTGAENKDNDNEDNNNDKSDTPLNDHFPQVPLESIEFSNGGYNNNKDEGEVQGNEENKNPKQSFNVSPLKDFPFAENESHHRNGNNDQEEEGEGEGDDDYKNELQPKELFTDEHDNEEEDKEHVVTELKETITHDDSDDGKDGSNDEDVVAEMENPQCGTNEVTSNANETNNDQSSNFDHDVTKNNPSSKSDNGDNDDNDEENGKLYDSILRVKEEQNQEELDVSDNVELEGGKVQEELDVSKEECFREEPSATTNTIIGNQEEMNEKKKEFVEIPHCHDDSDQEEAKVTDEILENEKEGIPSYSQLCLTKLYCCGRRCDDSVEANPSITLSSCGIFVSVFKWLLRLFFNAACIYLVVVNIGATQQANQAAKYLFSVQDQLYTASSPSNSRGEGRLPPEDTTMATTTKSGTTENNHHRLHYEGPVCAFSNPYSDKDTTTFPNAAMALAANYTIAHCGACAQCSTWHNLEVQWTMQNNLNNLSRQCALSSSSFIDRIRSFLFGNGWNNDDNSNTSYDTVLECHENEIGFDVPCSDCWAEREECAMEYCSFLQLQSSVLKSLGGNLLDNKNNNVDKLSSLDEVIMTEALCEETMCGIDFNACSGASLSRMNIVNNVKTDSDDQNLPPFTHDGNGNIISRQCLLVSESNTQWKYLFGSPE